MDFGLRLFLIIFSICWIILISYFLRKDKLSVKYSLVWFSMAFVLLVLGIFPGFLSGISHLFGFQVASSFIVGIILTLLMFITLILTIIIVDQKKKIVMLIQEVSMIKGNNK